MLLDACMCYDWLYYNFLITYTLLIEYWSDDIMAFCYSIVMVPNKRFLHQASGSGLEPGTCIVSNGCDHWSSVCLKYCSEQFPCQWKAMMSHFGTLLYMFLNYIFMPLTPYFVGYQRHLCFGICPSIHLYVPSLVDFIIPGPHDV